MGLGPCPVPAPRRAKGHGRERRGRPRRAAHRRDLAPRRGDPARPVALVPAPRLSRPISGGPPMTRLSSPRPNRDLVPMLAATVVGASLVAPWVLGFASSHAAVATHIAFAMTFGPIALMS